jgi:hypothetical protein
MTLKDPPYRVEGFSAKQNAAVAEWLSPDLTEICQDGAARAGKTFHSIRAIIDRAVTAPGSRHMIARLRFAHMKLSVWRQTIFDPTQVSGEVAARLGVPDGSFVPFLDTIVHPKYYRVNKVDYIITFWNGAEIIGTGLDTAERVQKIMGTEFCTVFVNEATQITYQTYQKLKTRCVQRIENVQNKLVIDCNPLNRYHWIYKYFHLGLDPDSEKPLPEKILKRCHQRSWFPTDNPSLRDIDIDLLDSLTGTERQRLFLAQWVNQEGLVYPGWGDAIVEPFHIPQDWPVVGAVDFGYTNPFAFGWFAYDPGSETWYLIDEHYEPGKTVAEHCVILKKGPLIHPAPGELHQVYVRRELRMDWIVADHDAEDRATMAANGLQTLAADKDIRSGLQAVTDLLAAQTGLKLRIFRTCVQANAEAALYSWPEQPDGKNAREEPKKEKDHMMDLVRYFAKQIKPTRAVLQTRSPVVESGVFQNTSGGGAADRPVPRARQPGVWRGR